MTLSITIKKLDLEDEIKKLNDQGYTVYSSKENPTDKKILTLESRYYSKPPEKKPPVVEEKEVKKEKPKKKYEKLFDFIKRKT